MTSLQKPRHSPAPAEPLPRVLIVDDRAENLLALEAVLEPLAVEVVRASSGLEAIARSAEQEFAVVLLDVMMPGVDGLETARQLKARSVSRLTPIIFLTALDVDRRRVHDGYASGAVDYLLKPIDPAVVRAKVSAFVDLYRNRRTENWQQRRRYADQVAAAAEAAYREGDQRFQLLAESVPAMVWTARGDGRVEFMNAYGAAYVGVSLQDVASLRWSRHVHPDDVGFTRERWKQAVRG
nr:response regulator [Gemmatimonadaceae bacterium]